MYSNGGYHSNGTYRVHLYQNVNTCDQIIAALQTKFDIRIIQGDVDQERLIRVCDYTWNLVTPLEYNNINTWPKDVYVVHLLPKIVSFRIEHVLNLNYQGRTLRAQISAHDKLPEIKQASHTALGLRANQTVIFEDSSYSIIQPTWSDFPHHPNGSNQPMPTMRLVVRNDSLPAIPFVSAIHFSKSDFMLSPKY
jgi:hypothetical protein